MGVDRVFAGRQRVQLGAQGLDVGVDGAVAAFQRIAPDPVHQLRPRQHRSGTRKQRGEQAVLVRSEEHTSELQSLMRISYAVFCLKKKKQQNTYQYITK